MRTAVEELLDDETLRRNMGGARVVSGPGRSLAGTSIATRHDLFVSGVDAVGELTAGGEKTS
jgi:hypothetical protein